MLKDSNNRNHKVFLGIIYFFILPVILCPAILDPFYFPKILFLSLIQIIISLYLIFNRRLIQQKAQKIPIIFTIWLTLILVSIVSGFVAVNFSEFLSTVNTFILLGLLAFNTYFLVDGETESFAFLAKFAIISGLFLSLVCLFQFYNIGFTWLPGSLLPYGFMGHKNIFSAWLFLLMPFVTFLLNEKKLSWRLLSMIAIALMTFDIVIIQSRATWLALLLFVFILLLSAVTVLLTKEYNVPHPFSFLKNSIISGLIVTFVVVLTFSAGLRQRIPDSNDGVLKLEERTKSIAKFSEDTSATERILAWKNSLLMAKDHPYIGVGAGNWKIRLPEYGLGGYFSNIQSGYYVYLQPHNDFLSVLCETGIFGLAAYLTFFGVLIFYSIREIVRKSSMREIFLISLLLAAIFGYLVISFFGFPKDRIELFTLMFFIAVLITGISFYPDNQDANSDSKHNGKRVIFINSVLIFAIIYSIFSAIFSLIRMDSEMFARRAIIDRSKHNWVQVIDEIDKAYYPTFSSMDPMATPLPFYRAEADYCLFNYRQAITDYTKSLKIHPFHLHSNNDIGTCYEKIGEHQKALDYYAKALKISPHFDYTFINIAAVYYNLGNYQKAYEAISKCDTNSSNKIKIYKQIILQHLKEQTNEKVISHP